jgi:hypothetical protein
MLHPIVVNTEIWFVITDKLTSIHVTAGQGAAVMFGIIPEYVDRVLPHDNRPIFGTIFL